MEIQNVNLKLNEKEKEIIFSHKDKEFIKLNLGGFIFKDHRAGLDYFSCRNIFNNLKKYIYSEH